MQNHGIAKDRLAPPALARQTVDLSPILLIAYQNYRRNGIDWESGRYSIFAIAQKCVMVVVGQGLPQFPENGWRIMKLASWSGRDLVDDWLKGLPIGERRAVKVELETMLRFLRHIPAQMWNRPQFAWIQGDKYQGIGEIILDCNGIPYRPLGCFGRQPDEFTLLLGARKDRKRRGLVQWNPQNALDTADKSRKELLDGVRTVYEYAL